MAATELLGTIIAAYPNATYTVRLADESHISASLHGKLRVLAAFTRGRLHVGDTVIISLSPFAQKRGIILKRQPP